MDLSAMREKRIGVLYGGLSAERDVSLRSGKAMGGALERRGYTVVYIDVGRDLPLRLLQERVDVALIALHGPLGEDGTVQGMLEVMGIPYTGSGMTASAVCMDKVLCKRLFREAGVPTPAWRELELAPGDSSQKMAERLRSELTLPVFVKPIRSGSSVGASPVRHADELQQALEFGFAATPYLLMEQMIEGSELTLSVLNGEPLPFIQIKPVQGFYDYKNKYTAGCTHYLIPPPDVGPTAQELARRAGLAAYRTAGCRGLARVDVLVDGQGEPWVLEINTIPGMTELSLAPKAAAAVGLYFDELVERILADAALEQCGG